MFFVRHETTADFLRTARAALERNEAEGNLMLGLCLQVGKLRARGFSTSYFATVRDGRTSITAAVMVRPHNVIIFSDAPNGAAHSELIAADIASGHWAVPGVVGRREHSRHFAMTWTALTGQAMLRERRTRLYELRSMGPVHWAPGSLRHASRHDLELAAGWVLRFEREALGRSGPAEARRIAAVSMAAKSRETAGGASIDLVYTPPELRRKGYAASCVAALSAIVMASGRRYCCLFAAASNRASNRTYAKIGYTPVCDIEEYAFIK
jgi:predicted GNAT family acetyltransferase